MSNIEIFILTHKKINEDYDELLYKPLLNGAALLNQDWGYIRDDAGENISKLNPYFAELTGQYWAWKNSKAKIIGFVHYRRWFARNLKFDKLTEEDIISNLKKNDIILPQKARFNDSLRNIIQKGLKTNPDYGVKYEDYLLLENIIQKEFSDYLESFQKVMDGKFQYNNNMFICDKELADEYFEFIFGVFDILFEKIDFSKYSSDNRRVFGFMSEILLTVFVLKNQLKIKEYFIFANERKFPLLQIFSRRFPIIGNLEFKLANR